MSEYGLDVFMAPPGINGLIRLEAMKRCERSPGLVAFTSIAHEVGTHGVARKLEMVREREITLTPVDFISHVPLFHLQLKHAFSTCLPSDQPQSIWLNIFELCRC